LVSATVELPPVMGVDELHLRFWQWFSYAGDDYGQVQVSVWDPMTSTWGSWTNEGELVTTGSGGWSLKSVDLTAYAGERVRIAFLHASGAFNVGAGWYVDDIALVTTTPTFTGEFESGWDDWSADRGVWQIGTPLAGPAGCYAGSGCAGTVLDGNYPTYTSSRLVSASMDLPIAGGGEDVHLRCQQWFSYAGDDYGQTQVSVWDPMTSTWLAWVNVGPQILNVSGGWSLRDVILTAYEGQRVRIAFLHASGAFNISSGWYIDSCAISVF
jgi:hypothetical protein